MYKVISYKIIDKLFEGKNISIFAYGASGAGKTYTMMGESMDSGIIQNIINDIF